MGETRIKICGITSPEDAVLCHGLGADYLGVIFAESVRRVDPARAAEIRRAVPEATLVGVFEGADLARVVGTALTCSLDMVQLHGDEPPSDCADLRKRAHVPIIKTFIAERNAVPASLGGYEDVEYVLFDRDKRGVDRRDDMRRLWAAAAEASRHGRHVFLAGGLSPDNVRAAIESVIPFAVDVCSGVERAPGIKDERAVRRFIAEVRG